MEIKTFTFKEKCFGYSGKSGRKLSVFFFFSFNSIFLSKFLMNFCFERKLNLPWFWPNALFPKYLKKN